MRPGVDVISSAMPPPRTAPTDTGVAFMIAATEHGPPVALCRSMGEFVSRFGDRGSGGEQQAYDAADTYFHEGGSQLYVSRLNPTVMPDSASATRRGSKASDGEAGTQALDVALQPALDALTADLGPGQIFIADPLLAVDPANQSALLAHAAACNRVALLSAADDDATALAAAGAALNTDASARYGALFAPSAIVPGVVAGTTRTVPYAAAEAGIIARNDPYFTPNQPAAGDLGQTVWALDVFARYTDQEYADLNVAGVNMARVIYGGVRTYGYRSCVDPDASPAWLMFGWARLNMAIVAQAEAIGEHYVFSQLDGRGKTIAAFNGELTAMLSTFYDAGALYGATPDDAFEVLTNSAVNTPETIANGELHAVLKVKMSPAAEWVVIEIVKIATTEQLAPLAAAAA